MVEHLIGKLVTLPYVGLMFACLLLILLSPIWLPITLLGVAHDCWTEFTSKDS